MYADDAKLYQAVNSTNDCLVIQESLDGFVGTCRELGLELSADKCQVCSFSRSKNPIDFEDIINDSPLRKVEMHVDLGVKFVRDSNFKQHIDDVVAAGRRVLGFIIRISKDFRSIEPAKALYCAYVRSKLKCNSIIWSPEFNNRFLLLERVHRRLLEYLCYVRDGIYPERGLDNLLLCLNFNFTPLEIRRKCINAIIALKIIKEMISVAEVVNAIKIKEQQINLRYPRNIIKPNVCSFFDQQVPAFRLADSLTWLISNTGKDLDYFLDLNKLSTKLILNCNKP